MSVELEASMANLREVNGVFDFAEKAFEWPIARTAELFGRVGRFLVRSEVSES